MAILQFAPIEVALLNTFITNLTYRIRIILTTLYRIALKEKSIEITYEKFSQEIPTGLLEAVRQPFIDENTRSVHIDSDRWIQDNQVKNLIDTTLGLLQNKSILALKNENSCISLNIAEETMDYINTNHEMLSQQLTEITYIAMYNSTIAGEPDNDSLNNQQVIELQNSAAQLKQENADLSRELEQAHQLRQQVADNCNSMLQKYCELNTQYQTLREENAAIKQQLNQYQYSGANLTEESRKQKKPVFYSFQNTTHQVSLENAMQKIKQLETENEQLRQQIANFQITNNNIPTSFHNHKL